MEANFFSFFKQKVNAPISITSSKGKILHTDLTNLEVYLYVDIHMSNVLHELFKMKAK